MNNKINTQRSLIINTSDLPAGIYSLQLTFDNGKLIEKKFVKVN